jgi:branched-chain amino acid transport system substrate-binding protein
MTDKSGALAIYGPSQTQGFYLGLEYATEGTMEVAGRPIASSRWTTAATPTRP